MDIDINRVIEKRFDAYLASPENSLEEEKQRKLLLVSCAMARMAIDPEWRIKTTIFDICDLSPKESLLHHDLRNAMRHLDGSLPASQEFDPRIVLDAIDKGAITAR